MLDRAAANLPAGNDEWETVAQEYSDHFGPEYSRTGENLKEKFKKLRNTKKPTGFHY